MIRAFSRRLIAASPSRSPSLTSLSLRLNQLSLRKQHSWNSKLSPFHLAIPVHDVEEATKFYERVLGCGKGRVSKGKWQDLDFGGHQVVLHFTSKSYRGVDHFNVVDKDDVPVPHFGIALPVADFHRLRERVEKEGVEFIVKPHLRFAGKPGEQWTMFFKDPSGNNLEFKAMTNPNNLFAAYEVNE